MDVQSFTERLLQSKSEMKEREYVESKMRQIIQEDIEERHGGTSDDTIKEYEETEEFKRQFPGKIKENENASPNTNHKEITSINENVELDKDQASLQ